jgi:hypothetical protein
VCGAVAIAAGARAAVLNFNDGLSGGARWDAAPRSVPGLGERSLDSGLRYALEGGSYEAYRDFFTWDAVPSVAAFQAAVEQAFAAWTSVDPATGLRTDLVFVLDLATPVKGPPVGSTANPGGAEIDLLAETDGITWDPGDPRSGGEAYLIAPIHSEDLTLTSGTTGYPGYAMWGADVKMNADPSFVWTLDWFRIVLTHEIGHALGLEDMDYRPPGAIVIDDDYDGSTHETALATLTNSWALLIDPFDPSASPLGLYDVHDSDLEQGDPLEPGVDSPGVHILMESRDLAPLLGLEVPLQNDDYAARQFLYPWVAPEPALALLQAAAGAALAALRYSRDR